MDSGRGYTKRATKANRGRFLSKPLKKNIRANVTRKRRSATYRIKAETKELNRAAMIAHMVAQAAQQIGAGPPAAGAAGGAGAAAAADPLEAEVNLDQAVVIMDQVVNQAENPAPALVEVRNQAAAVRERGRGCSFRIRVKDIFLIIMALLNAYSLEYPLIAPPREATYFDTAAGYMALGGTIGGVLSLDMAGTYTACGIGLQLVGGLTRGIASASGVHPMTPSNVKREALKFAEYMPGPAGQVMKYGKYAGLARLTGETLHRYAETGDKLRLRGGIPAVKPAPETPFVSAMLAPFSNAAVNVATKAVTPHGISESKVLNIGVGAVASSLLL